jgi:hypothetical protein
VNDLTLRIDSTEVSDAEVAAVTVAILAGGASRMGEGEEPRSGASAWRAAALREATDGRRLGRLAALRQAHGG